MTDTVGPVFHANLSSLYASSESSRYANTLSGERYARAQSWFVWLRLQPLRHGIKRALGLPCPPPVNRRFRVTRSDGDSMTVEPEA